MIWWAKSRRLALLGVTTVAAAILCVPGVGILVSLPSLLGGPGFASPVSLLLPLAAMIAYCQGLARQNITVEQLAVRRIWYADLAAAAGCAAAFTSGLLIDDGPVMLATVRNTVGYLGAALLATWLFSLATAALLPLVWALLAAMGGLPFGDPSLVSWPSRAADDLGSWAMAIVLAVAGPIAYLAHHATLTERLRRVRPPSAPAEHLPGRSQ